MSMDKLVSDIDDYCAKKPMSATAFGRNAMNDPGFVHRIRSGGECLPRTVERVRSFMLANPPENEETSQPQGDAA